MSNFTVKRVATIKQAADLYPAFSESSLRWLVSHEKENNFSEVIRRVGRRILLDLDDFENWISKQKESGGK